jgi:very-short-patch-repair endonuclease
MKFRRQFSVGKYILDFYSPEYSLGIEVDGDQHYENKIKRRDRQRTLELAEVGIRILRFSNIDVLQNINGVCKVIERELEKTPSPQSSPLRGEEA